MYVFDDTATQKLWEDYRPVILADELPRGEFIENLLDPKMFAEAHGIMKLGGDWRGPWHYLESGKRPAILAERVSSVVPRLRNLADERNLRLVYAQNWSDVESEYELDQFIIDYCSYLVLGYEEADFGGLIDALSRRKEMPAKFARDSLVLSPLPVFQEAVLELGRESVAELLPAEADVDLAWGLVSRLQATFEFCNRHKLAMLPSASGTFDTPAASDVKFDVRKNDRRYRTEQEQASAVSSLPQTKPKWKFW